MAKLNGVSYKEAALFSKVSGGKFITVDVAKLVIDVKDTDAKLLNYGTISVTPNKGKLTLVTGHALAKRLIESQGVTELKVRLVSGYALTQAKEGEPVPATEMPNIVNKLENQWKGGNGHARVRRVGEKPNY